MSKESFIAVIGVLGGFIAQLFGGWTAAMTTLVIFLGSDFILGLGLAAVFKKSTKSETGALESNACWKGLIKKGSMLLVVLIAYRLDMIANTTFIKDGTIIAFIANELISIVEKLGLMGVPVPEGIVNMIEVLKNKAK